MLFGSCMWTTSLYTSTNSMTSFDTLRACANSGYQALLSEWEGPGYEASLSQYIPPSLSIYWAAFHIVTKLPDCSVRALQAGLEADVCLCLQHDNLTYVPSKLTTHFIDG